MIPGSASFGEVGPVYVETSQNGGLSSEQIASLCSRRLMYISEDAPPEIREQANAFKIRVENLLLGYIQEAKRSERDRCVQIALNGGYNDLADLLRRA
tara:strand:- start:1799 stop:2092 length:294 start_codon:yes stop_codon:yes gene_type:complete